MTERNKKFDLTLHYNWVNSYMFVKGETYKLKAENPGAHGAPFCLGSVSKDLSVDNMKKTKLSEYIYHLLVDCDSVDVADILDIHKYLMKEHGIK